MAWTNKQKSVFAQACSAIGWGQEHRRMVLSSFPHAIAGGAHPTSTSPRLNNSDFEHAMAIVEKASGGQVKLCFKDSGRYRYSLMYWQRQAEDDLSRMRGLAQRLAKQLESAGQLEPDGAGLAGWIRKRVTDGRTDRLQDLSYSELFKLIEGLKAYRRRSG